MQNNPQRETKIYQDLPFGIRANALYRKDLRKMQKQGWNLVSCTETGKDLFGYNSLTAIYERTVQPGPVMNVQNVPYLLSLLAPHERAQFESEMQQVVDRWLAQKAR